MYKVGIALLIIVMILFPIALLVRPNSSTRYESDRIVFFAKFKGQVKYILFLFLMFIIGFLFSNWHTLFK